MTYQPPQRNRANLFAVLGIALVLVVGAVVAIVLTTGDGNGDDTGGRSAAPASTAPAAEVKLASERDAAVKAGSEIVAALNTLDYRDVEAGLDRWESLSTGALLDDVRASRQRAADQVTQTRSVTQGHVLDAALSELDAGAGTARLLAALRIDQEIDGQKTEKRTRIQLDLARTPQGWKAAAITVV
jgi:Mce-associated membrane protein